MVMTTTIATQLLKRMVWGTSALIHRNVVVGNEDNQRVLIHVLFLYTLKAASYKSHGIQLPIFGQSDGLSILLCF